MEETKLLSTQDIIKHNTPEDCWLVIEDQVWDCTDFSSEHPGGSSRKLSELFAHKHCAKPSPVILRYAGRDATQAYSEIHSPSVVKNSLPVHCFKGNLDRSTITAEWSQEPMPKNPSQATSDKEKPPLHTIINA